MKLVYLAIAALFAVTAANATNPSSTGGQDQASSQDEKVIAAETTVVEEVPAGQPASPEAPAQKQ